jgi:hypothetical protein
LHGGSALNQWNPRQSQKPELQILSGIRLP